ncbi:hypothetical protein OF83DRAFT_414472 [Amylostereum chailletii]|nr:hypothetical protein OF83DRAFT_414472 [Amylostereum chailletii]
MTVIINPPGAMDFEPALDLQDIMGTWYVTHSTLPMWKKNKDVTITYTARADPSSTAEEQPVQIDDVVEYRGKAKPVSSKRTRIVGVDTVEASSADPSSSSSSSPPSTRFKWRGSGLLFPLTSRWQLLGYASDETPWAVTYFEKTLFTPEGIDIYARSKEGLPEGLLAEIKEGLKQVGGKVGELAGELFEVERS